MSRPQEIYDKLRDYYGNPDWWSDNPYEVIIGAVLVQNTAWESVEKVIKNFDSRLSPQYVESVYFDELCALIRPCGFYNAKAVYLKNITAWYKQYDYSVAKVQARPLAEIRKELLSIKGIGEETADVILLYAFFFPVFVVDAYIKRLIERLQLPVNLTNNAIKTYFGNNLENDVQLYGNYHALILLNGKKHCQKKPVCTSCPLIGECLYTYTQNAGVQSSDKKGGYYGSG